MILENKLIQRGDLWEKLQNSDLSSYHAQVNNALEQRPVFK